MTRHTDWQARLIAFIDQCKRTPFSYGKNDCALFAAGAVKAMTGADPAKGFRGKYSTFSGGLKLLSKHGHKDHIAMTASMLTEIPVAQAQAGDIAVVPGEDGDALGVVQGEWIYILTVQGLALLDLLRAKRAFRV